MNQDQIYGMLKIIVPSIVTYAVGKGWIPAGSAADIGGAIITLIAAGWSYAAHTDSAKIAAVTAIPEVAKVIVAPTAPPSSAAATAARDTSQPKVQKG